MTRAKRYPSPPAPNATINPYPAPPALKGSSIKVDTGTNIEPARTNIEPTLSLSPKPTPPLSPTNNNTPAS